MEREALLENIRRWRARIDAESRELAEKKTTMIIVTHEMAFARDVADNCIFMDGGVIVESGKASEVIGHPKEERTRRFVRRIESQSGEEE